MQVNLPAGRYVVAVSGGVDSVVLLHLLAQKEQRTEGREQGNSELCSENSALIVAHFDHGIREDSSEDRKLVQELAIEYGLPFEYAEGKLGAGASEAVAREARYTFLRQLREKYNADAILTAHHQDDVLETAILNLLRGASRKGFASLRNTSEIKRPLLAIPKQELLRYAKRAGLRWHEDSTNADPKYLRNYVRLHILSRFAEADREALLGLVQCISAINRELDEQLDTYLEGQLTPAGLNRHAFILLTHAEACEVLAYWLRKEADTELSHQLVERLVVAAKTGKAGTRVDVDGRYWLEVTRDELKLTSK